MCVCVCLCYVGVGLIMSIGSCEWKCVCVFIDSVMVIYAHV